MTCLIFDTETSGMCQWQQPSEHPSQPHLVEFAGVLVGDDDRPQSLLHLLVKPDGWDIPIEATNIHGISTARAKQYGIPVHKAVDMIYEFMSLADEGFVNHNCQFDAKIIRAAAHRAGRPDRLQYFREKPRFCTMLAATDVCKIPGPRGHKWPKLAEALQSICGVELTNAHTALADTKGCMTLYLELKKRGLVTFKVPAEKEAA